MDDWMDDGETERWTERRIQRQRDKISQVKILFIHPEGYILPEVVNIRIKTIQ